MPSDVGPIRSVRNPKVVEAAGLRRTRARRTTGLTLLEGPHLLAEAVVGRADVLRVFGLETDSEAVRCAAACGAEWIPVERRVLERLAATETPRGPVAVMRIPEPAPPSGDAVWVDVTDPGNAGTIIRTAAAFGFGVVFRPEAVDPWSPKTLRSAAGAHFHTTIDVGDPPAGSVLIATVAAGGAPPEQVAEHLDRDRRWTILIGSEAHGLGAEVEGRADAKVTIPMPGGVESLNAAVAAAIVTYVLSTRHRGPEAPPAQH